MSLSLLVSFIILEITHVKVWAIGQGGTRDRGIMRQHVLADGRFTSAATEANAGLKLYYTRDAAGFNNVRLTFETLVAVAAATGRELVIPGRSHIDHLKEPIHEFDVYSRKALRRVINFSELSQAADLREYDRPEGATDAAVLTKFLWNYDVMTDLPADRDWCFFAKYARIQHFECLKLKPEDQARASAAVFNGLQFRQSWWQEARKALETLGLQAGQYIAVHLRQGDFQQTQPRVKQDGSKVSATLRKYVDGKPLLILTDAASTDKSIFVDIPATSQASKVVFTAKDLPLLQNNSELHGLMVDTILGAMAAQFIGTPGSTFTNGINLLRRKKSICMQRNMTGSFVEHGNTGLDRMTTELYSNVYWFSDDVNYVLPQDTVKCKAGELGWSKQTTFEQVNLLDVHDCETWTD